MSEPYNGCPYTECVNNDPEFPFRCELLQIAGTLGGLIAKNPHAERLGQFMPEVESGLNGFAKSHDCLDPVEFQKIQGLMAEAENGLE